MRTILMLTLLAAGCAEEPQASRPYSCTIIYRCVGDADLSARVGNVCAVDGEEAVDLGTELGYKAVAEGCPNGWMYIRPLCSPEDTTGPTGC